MTTSGRVEPDPADADDADDGDADIDGERPRGRADDAAPAWQTLAAGPAAAADDLDL